jgi:hypothetical protein
MDHECEEPLQPFTVGFACGRGYWGFSGLRSWRGGGLLSVVVIRGSMPTLGSVGLVGFGSYFAGHGTIYRRFVAFAPDGFPGLGSSVGRRIDGSYCVRDGGNDLRLLEVGPVEDFGTLRAFVFDGRPSLYRVHLTHRRLDSSHSARPGLVDDPGFFCLPDEIRHFR